jgi:hypothetical protein
VTPTIDARLRALEKPRRLEEQLIAERFHVLAENYVRSNLLSDLPPSYRERILDIAERQIRTERDAALAAEETRLRPLLGGSGRLRALREHAIALATRHDIAIVLDPGEWDNGRAYLDARRVAVRAAFTCDDDYATLVHEIGHILGESCEGLAHFRVKPDQPGCLACEAGAWQIGMRIALDWTAPMHALLARSLESYLRSTPGVLQAHDTLLALSSDIAFKQERQRRLRADLERERQQHAARRPAHAN